MPKLNFAWVKPVPGTYLVPVLLVGCATVPTYSVRPTPVPNESATAIQIERTISAAQAQDFDSQGARAVGPLETIAGFPVQSIIDRLSRVTERANLRYHGWLYQDNDPNAAALADGRIYISTGLLAYLKSRGSDPDELSFILGHELGHTVTQHLVKRYQYLQQQQVVLGLLAAGASVITKEASSGIQQAGKVALDVASMLQDVAASGYSQDQELEADQLGIRYVIRAGFNPQACLALLDDFKRFDSPSPIMRTHPYTTTRREYLQRYLQEIQPAPAADTLNERRKRELREAQKLYPAGSVSWKNLQRQIDALK